MVRSALAIFLAIFVVCTPVLGQAGQEAEVRGSNVPLFSEPDPDSEVVAILQRHTPVRVIGDAENSTGETKPISIETLGLSTVWFVPVEDINSAQTGWILERYLTSSSGVAIEAGASAPTVIPTLAPTSHARPATAVVTPEGIKATRTPTPASASASPTLTEISQQSPSVSDLIARNVAPCVDGIGTTYSTDELFAAGLGGTGETFLVDHDACTSPDPTGTRMSAQCSPEAATTELDAFAIYCRMDLSNEEAAPITVRYDQFQLASSSGRYPADETLSAQVAAHVDLATAPVDVAPAETKIGVVGFVLPVTELGEDVVLIWDSSVAGAPPDAELGSPSILLAAREPSLLDVHNLEPLDVASLGINLPPTPTSTVPAVATTVAEFIESHGLGLTDEEAEYVDAMSSITRRNGESLTRQSDLMESPRIGDTTWEADLQVEVDVWDRLEVEAMALQPPDSMGEIHTTYLEALSYQVMAGDELMASMPVYDIAGLERATRYMDESSRLTNTSLELLTTFLEDRGIAMP